MGILMAYWVQNGALDIASTAAWRLFFALQLLPGLVVAAITIVPRKLPRWLVQHNCDSEAISVLANLHCHRDTNDAVVRVDYADIRAAVGLEKSGRTPSYLTLLIKTNYRRRTALAMGLQCMHQLSGANIVLYYAAKVFAQTGRSGPATALPANCVSSALLLVSTVSLTLLIDNRVIDSYGRRKQIFIGHTSMGICPLIVPSSCSVTDPRISTPSPKPSSSASRTVPLVISRWHSSSPLLRGFRQISALNLPLRGLSSAGSRPRHVTGRGNQLLHQLLVGAANF